MAHTPTDRDLEQIAARSEVGNELSARLLDELKFGMNPEKRRWLKAALEGICSIPDQHRDNKKVLPTEAARVLALDGLNELRRWWKPELCTERGWEVHALTDTAALLQCWCSYRTTARNNRLADAHRLAGKLPNLTTANQIAA